MTAPAIGAHVGQYVVLREVGKGAMATVYEAEHVELGKRIALKAMHAHLAEDPTAASRFLREGKAAAQIQNPHVVDVYDVGTHDGVPYLVMELLDGPDLAALLRDRGKLPLRELGDVMLPVASAVHAAHAVGVIHRDLKPSNILIARRENGEVHPTILDFGISKVTSDVDRDLTASEVLLGTVHYMSPEQTRGGRNASALSDQYSLGVMLYECATGVKPFAGSSPYALMHAIVSARLTPPSALDPSLPGAFDDVVLRAMHRDPKKRFPDVRELGAAIVPWASPEVQRRWAHEFGVAPSSAVPRSRGRRGPLLVALAASALAAFALAVSTRPAQHAATVPASGIASTEPRSPEAPASAAAILAPSVPPHAEENGASAVVSSLPATDARAAAPPPASQVATDRRSARAVPAPQPVRAGAASTSTATPAASASAGAERGTNGALIVE
jgi:serine/threonine-protein kinase